MPYLTDLLGVAEGVPLDRLIKLTPNIHTLTLTLQLLDEGRGAADRDRYNRVGGGQALAAA